MDKKSIPIVLGILVFLLILWLVFLPGSDNPPSEVCFGNNCFKVELAVTEVQREHGLMNRTRLDDDKGMLFVFEKEDVYPFWMKNTLIPLDMIWVDSNDLVVYIKKNAEPCISDPCPLIDPGKKAKYVLEINGGLADDFGIREGDNVSIIY